MTSRGHTAGKGTADLDPGRPAPLSRPHCLNGLLSLQVSPLSISPPTTTSLPPLPPHPNISPSFFSSLPTSALALALRLRGWPCGTSASVLPQTKHISAAQAPDGTLLPSPLKFIYLIKTLSSSMCWKSSYLTNTRPAQPIGRAAPSQEHHAARPCGPGWPERPSSLQPVPAAAFPAHEPAAQSLLFN